MNSENKKEDSVSIQMMNELEPIIDMIDEGGPVHPNDTSCGGVPSGWIPSTQYDESDDLEAAKRIEPDAKKELSQLEIKAYKEVVKSRWDWYGEGKD